MRTKGERKLKVLVSAYACNPAVSPRLHPGEDLVGWNLVVRLARSHDLWIIAHDYNRQEIERVTQEKSSEGLNFIFVKLPSVIRLLYKIGFGERIYYYLWQIAAWRTAVRLHRIHRFDLSHHLTFGNYWMPSFIGAFLPIPFIWGPIGGGQKIPRSYRREFSLKERWSEYARDGAQWIGRHLLISRKLCMRRARAILVCNSETKAKFPTKYWAKIQYFPVNGISRKEMGSLAPSGLKERTYRLVTAGRFIRLKGFDILLRAYADFLQSGIRAELAIIGQGPEEMRLRQLARSLKIDRFVRFIIWLSRRELLSRLRRSDVFLFASLRDGGGAVVVEAMASGIPVVCLNIGGPGFHTRMEWGMKIHPGPPEETVRGFSKAISRLAGQRSLRRALGRAGRKRTLEYYLWDRLGERIENIYRRAFYESCSRPVME